MVKSPRKRTGPAIPNKAELASTATREQSARKYMSNTAAETPVVAAPQAAAKPPTPAKAAKPKPKAAKPTAPKQLPKKAEPIKTANDPARKGQSFAVRVLPAQQAQIEDIAMNLGVDRDYMVRVLRTATIKALNVIRDSESWASNSEGAKTRLADRQGEGEQIFRTSLQVSDGEMAAAHKAINDPLGMIMPHSVISAFGKVAFGDELEKLAAKAKG